MNKQNPQDEDDKDDDVDVDDADDDLGEQNKDADDDSIHQNHLLRSQRQHICIQL